MEHAPESTRRILIADDEPILRMLVRATLASHPELDLQEAANGTEAWARVTQDHPAIVLMDIAMPDRNGLDLTRSIRADPSLADVYVIMLTAKSQDADITAGLAAGANEYLTKPFSPLELRESVRHAAGV